MALAVLATGVALSHRVEPGIRVEGATLAGDTPALRFFPAGAGPHPIALLAHGVTASKETLFRFGEALAAAGFECTAVDLPGHGQSARSFSWNENAGTLGRLARTLGSVEVFVGHSMGAFAGAQAVREGGLSARLFIAVGALPNLGGHGPPLLLLAGRFEEAVPPAWLKARTDARLVLSPWSDHALELYDPTLVNAAVEAACALVGKTPPAAPTCWRWRLAGMVLGLLAALGLALGLPELPPRLAWVRGPLIAVIAIVAVAFTTGTWFGAAPALPRAPAQIAAMAIALLVVIGAGKLRVPRWSFAALAAALALGCAVMGVYFLALFASLGALVLLAGTVLGWIAAHRGSKRDGDVALAILVGYAIGQWMPRIF
jgi:hypothetical protein